MYLCDQLIIFKNGKIEDFTSALHKSDNAYTRELIKTTIILRSDIMKGAMAWSFLRLYILTFRCSLVPMNLNVFIPLRGGKSSGATNTVIGIVMAYMLTAMVFRPWAIIIARVVPLKSIKNYFDINAIALIIYGFTGLEGYFVARVMQGVYDLF